MARAANPAGMRNGGGGGEEERNDGAPVRMAPTCRQASRACDECLGLDVCRSDQVFLQKNALKQKTWCACKPLDRHPRQTALGNKGRLVDIQGSS